MMNIESPTEQIIIRTAGLVANESLTEKTIDDLTEEKIEELMGDLKIEKDTEGLYKIIALFGSTHSKAIWRDVFEKEYPHTVFDPKGENGWDKWYSKIEALFMAIAKVIVLGLHNGVSDRDTMFGGSMGSMLESTMTLLLAYMRGQKVVIYEELEFIESMDSPSSIILYIIKNFAWKEMHDLDASDVYILHDKEKAAQKAAELIEEPIDRRIVHKSSPRLSNKVVIVGSGWSGAEDNRIVEELYGEQVVDMRRDDDGKWGKAYQLAEAYLVAENGQKKEVQDQLEALIYDLEANLVNEVKSAGKVMCRISKDRLSKGAMTEIPMIIALCIANGIPIDINIEPLNPLQCLQNILPKQDMDDIREAQDIYGSQETISGEGLTTIKSILERAGFRFLNQKEDLNKVLRLLDILTRTTPDVDDWDNLIALLKEICEVPAVIRDIGNAERARVILVGHIARLARDERIGEIIEFSEGL